MVDFINIKVNGAFESDAPQLKLNVGFLKAIKRWGANAVQRRIVALPPAPGKVPAKLCI